MWGCDGDITGLINHRNKSPAVCYAQVVFIVPRGLLLSLNITTFIKYICVENSIFVHAHFCMYVYMLLEDAVYLQIQWKRQCSSVWDGQWMTRRKERCVLSSISGMDGMSGYSSSAMRSDVLRKRNNQKIVNLTPVSHHFAQKPHTYSPGCPCTSFTASHTGWEHLITII